MYHYPVKEIFQSPMFFCDNFSLREIVTEEPTDVLRG